MCPNNNRGRPTIGIEAKSVERKIRIEPYLDNMLAVACKELRITRSDAIRQGIIMFLKEADKIVRLYYDT